MLQDEPQKLWIPERDKFLKEFIRLEGRGEATLYQACQGLPGCLNEPVVRCRDCEGSQLYCQGCIVIQHTVMPLHHMEIWTGLYFQCISLHDLSHCIQLGHPPGLQCCNPSLAFDDDFVVLEINSIHRVALNFCNCATAQTHNIQLLHACWYPATTTNPWTAAMFQLLDHFQMYTFESKGSAFEYYQLLARLTDNTGTRQPKGRYESFLHMSRQHPGHGHDPNGVLGTKEGELAVLCPACPQPGRNLPADWDNVPLHMKWLYGLFLAIDANFRFLSNGWAYFMEQSSFKEVLEASGTQVQEKSSCASHNAVNLADTKNARGMAATGVGAIVCAWHNLTHPSLVSNLQKGEKYVNMDYIFFSTLQHASTVDVLNISYDIACQWSKHLWTQMLHYPSRMHLQPDDKVLTFVVPKFHLPAHILSCQTKYSLNLIKGMARTDGKAVECGWSNINPIATSTWEMGPGSRQDILDDHFGDLNWCKVCNLGPFLLWKLKEAIPEREQHILDLQDFEEAIPPASLSEWRIMIVKWETDFTMQASVRLELSQLEGQQLTDGVDSSLHPEVSPSVLIAAGIDLESLQQRLAIDMANIGTHATDNQLSLLQQQMNALHRCIEQWVQIQTLYMPCSPDTPNMPEEAVHCIKLWLPSAVVNLGIACDVNLCQIKWKLRCAQAHDGLQELPHTRSQAIIDTVQLKIDTWFALESLAINLSKLTWQIEFPKLDDADIWGMTKGQAGGEVEMEGQRLVLVSWIWKQHHGAGEEELLEVMHIEWCKARACANRWAEEVVLLQEEMRRVVAYFDWHAMWWDKRLDYHSIYLLASLPLVTTE
ncbi:uncharacterized protein BJ212DRAFT_1449387 [Suillus subaureus]|uniref:CxC2-like cysteine cluster KDZ transposase-associated domain-containing protein n=1 Tax=Suillus subaureus TaxID=48587 RepID=A0A9P7J7M1_9AGAM|nr:uncharacterized protein BJ212DRAFT_1449387 [Suillus subaureus]KAG1807133.1 hypothetical protein BJ212DRAFT_1449387 [Suillus subaureus]